MKVEFTGNGIQATMNSSYEEQKKETTYPIRWTTALVQGAVALILSVFSIGLGLIGGIGTTMIETLKNETNTGYAFLIATIISFVLIGISGLMSFLSIKSYLKKNPENSEKTKSKNSDVAGLGCAIVGLILCIISIILNICFIL